MLRQSVITSLRWATSGRLAGQFITWIFTVIVIRILSPSDYGTMAIASLVVGFFVIFEELGMSAAIVYRKNLTDYFAQQIFGLVLCVASIIYVIIFLAAPYVATFFEVPVLREVVRVLALRVPISAFGAVPSALIQKELRFKNKALVEFTATVLASVTTLLLALYGLSVWALVAGNLCLATVQVLGYWITIRRFLAPRFGFRNISSDFRFGSFVSMDRIVWFLYSRADVFFVGKFLGNEILGFYTVAMQIAKLPMTKVAGILNEVGFAAFSKIQDDTREVRRNLLSAVRQLSLASFPVFFGISAIAPEVVGVLLGPKWLAVETPLTLLALVVPLRLINGVTPGFLFALGRVEIAIGNSLLALLILGPAFAVAARYGDLSTVCLVWLIGYPLYYLICLSRALPVISLKMVDYLRPVFLHGLTGAAMYALVRIASTGLHSLQIPPWMVMLVLISIGATFYIGVLWHFARSDLKKLIELARG